MKAKDEAEDLAQEMAELRYQITGLLEEERKRRACIEQASLQRIAQLEAQVLCLDVEFLYPIQSIISIYFSINSFFFRFQKNKVNHLLLQDGICTKYSGWSMNQKLLEEECQSEVCIASIPSILGIIMTTELVLLPVYVIMPVFLGIG